MSADVKVTPSLARAPGHRSCAAVADAGGEVGDETASRCAIRCASRLPNAATATMHATGAGAASGWRAWCTPVSVPRPCVIRPGTAACRSGSGRGRLGVWTRRRRTPRSRSRVCRPICSVPQGGRFTEWSAATHPARDTGGQSQAAGPAYPRQRGAWNRGFRRRVRGCGAVDRALPVGLPLRRSVSRRPLLQHRQDAEAWSRPRSAR